MHEHARRNPNVNPRSTSRRGNGVTVLLLVMVVVVGAVVAYGLMRGVDEDGDQAPVASGDARDQPADRSGYKTLDHKPFPKVEPWAGDVAGRSGRVEVGMNRSRLLEQFGEPHVTGIDNARTKAGVEELTWYAGAGGEGRVFRDGGGRRLLVKIDQGSNKVVWFQPPDPPRERPIRSPDDLPQR